MTRLLVDQQFIQMICFTLRGSEVWVLWKKIAASGCAKKHPFSSAVPLSMDCEWSGIKILFLKSIEHSEWREFQGNSKFNTSDFKLLSIKKMKEAAGIVRLQINEPWSYVNGKTFSILIPLDRGGLWGDLSRTDAFEKRFNPQFRLLRLELRNRKIGVFGTFQADAMTKFRLPVFVQAGFDLIPIYVSWDIFASKAYLKQRRFNGGSIRAGFYIKSAVEWWLELSHWYQNMGGLIAWPHKLDTLNYLK